MYGYNSVVLEIALKLSRLKWLLFTNARDFTFISISTLSIGGNCHGWLSFKFDFENELVKRGFLNRGSNLKGKL